MPTSAGRTAGFALLVVALGAYFVWCWTAGRRTLPMKTWRLRLVDPTGAPPAARARSRAMPRRGSARPSRSPRTRRRTRASAWLALAIGYAWALVDPDRRFLHDRLAGTRIVRDPPGPRAARRNALSADHSGCAGACARASATPAAISTMPASASASSVSPNSIHAISAVTGGTR